jgi:hypothetical protein
VRPPFPLRNSVDLCRILPRIDVFEPPIFRI